MAELHDRLSQLRRADVLVRLAWCSALTHSWQTVRNSEMDKRVRDYILPSWGSDAGCSGSGRFPYR